MKNTLEFIMNGAAVTRYHTCDLIKSETVGHHSHGVAMLCLVIDPIASRQLLTSALIHDLAEQCTGDIPSPVKRQLGVGQQVAKIEEDILLKAGIETPVLNLYEQAVLKMADIAHGALKCAREVNLGNEAMRSVFNNYISYSEELVVNQRSKELINTIKEMIK